MKKYLVFYLVILFLGAILPINGTNSALNNNYILNIRWDYLIHAVVYLPMFGLFRINNKKRIGINLLISLAIAASLEGIQLLTPWRTFNVNDLLANSIGAAIGFIIFLSFYQRTDFIKVRTK